MRFEIAGITIDIHSDCPINVLEEYSDFISNSNQDPALSIYLKPVDKIQKPQGTICLDDSNKWILRGTGSHAATVFKCSRRDPENEPIYKVEANNNWQVATVTFLKNNINVAEEVAILIGHILFKNRLIFQSGLIIHASAITWNGRGILFTAPSETGKSTQARLWSKHMNAKVINDDSPAVRMIDDQAIVFGTPWSGSKRIFQNAQAPLSAIIVLEQSGKNSIRQLTPAESIPMLLPRCFLPYHDPSLMDMACSILEKIVKATPVYHFKCRPEKNAVEVVAKCIR